MPSEANGLRAELKLAERKIASPGELKVEVVLTNTGRIPLRINTLFFGFTSIMLKVRRAADKELVPPGPPPMPPEDDGKAGRITLPPGGTHEESYSGAKYFRTTLPPGRFQVQFRYISAGGQPGDWQGEIETEWVEFEVNPSLAKPPGTHPHTHE